MRYLWKFLFRKISSRSIRSVKWESKYTLECGTVYFNFVDTIISRGSNTMDLWMGIRYLMSDILILICWCGLGPPCVEFRKKRYLLHSLVARFGKNSLHDTTSELWIYRSHTTERVVKEVRSSEWIKQLSLKRNWKTPITNSPPPFLPTEDHFGKSLSRISSNLWVCFLRTRLGKVVLNYWLMS